MNNEYSKLEAGETRVFKLYKGKDVFYYRLHDKPGHTRDNAVCFRAAEKLEWPESDLKVEIQEVNSPGFTYVCGEWDPTTEAFWTHVGPKSKHVFEEAYGSLALLLQNNPQGFYYKVSAA